MSKISFVVKIEGGWNYIDDEINQEIDKQESMGWELHQIAGPTFNNGTYVLLVFRKDADKSNIKESS